jgi:CheY-like chemotaxis protein
VFITEVTRKVLERQGYRVYALEDCENLLENIRRIKPDLILMDLLIPVLGGDAAIRLLKHHPETSHIPVLIFSGESNIRKIASQSEADGYIKKPFALLELENSIRKLLVEKCTPE